jgi:hypothetical protein
MAGEIEAVWGETCIAEFVAALLGFFEASQRLAILVGKF